MSGLYRCAVGLAASLLLVGITGCAGTPQHGGWYALQFMEKPNRSGPSTHARIEDLAHFEPVLAYEKRDDRTRFSSAIEQVQEGDVIAYRKTFWDAYRDIVKLKLNAVGYRLFKYGHLAIVVQDQEQPGKLRLFSSESFKGPNIREDLDTLHGYDFDVFRLNKPERLDRVRLHEFVRASIAKAGKWYGYDFMGMFGLANSNMRPTKPEQIGHDYICSTVVVSALYYAGLELDAIKRDGVLDLVTPAQVVNSKGHFFTVREEPVLVEVTDKQ